MNLEEIIYRGSIKLVRLISYGLFYGTVVLRCALSVSISDEWERIWTGTILAFLTIAWRH